MRDLRLGFLTHLFSVIFLLAINPSAQAQDAVPKLVYLVEDNDMLVASNILFNRFDKYQLGARERVLDYAVGNAVIVVVTNQHLLGYSVYLASWRSRGLIPDEVVNHISAEDYSALVQTSKRFLSFNGKNGVWTQTSRSKIFSN
jgi:hypothetical protein